MPIYKAIIENKEIVKIIYALIIVFICFLITLKAHRLFRLSFHSGIRYFRNAFFFYGLGFAARYFLKFISADYFLINPLFEFFLVMAGFFLLYSLLWKRIDSHNPRSSLLNRRIGIFYLMAIIIILLDYVWNVPYFMYSAQIIIFLFASIISYSNYKKDNYKNKFLRFYFIAMVLGLFAWILNALAAVFFSWNQMVLINIYLLNAIFFLLFLYGVVKVTKT